MLALGESISGWQWAGIGCIVAALACVMLGPRFMGHRI
jgi:O-acetylserine/cysteine efflux transporter